MAQPKGASAGNGGAAARSSREPVALSDQQWAALAPLVPGADSAHGRLAAPQSVVEGILYALRNGMGMQSVPPPYPSGSTLYRRYTAWTANGQWDAIWAAFLDTLSPAERRQWEAAARQRPGGAAEASTSLPDRPGASTSLPDRPGEFAALPGRPEIADEPAQFAQAAEDGKPNAAATEAPAPAGRVATADASRAAGIQDIASPRQPEASRNGHATPGQNGAIRDSSTATDDAAPAAAEPAAQVPQLTFDAAHDRVTQRLDLSAAESEIVRRRIDDHGVSAALIALDEVEGRIASGMMRGVGGMPMSAFEIWVCAVGLARRPVERPRAPRPERSDRQDGDRDRRKRQWRKAT